MSKRFNDDKGEEQQPSHRTISREDSKKEESKHSVSEQRPMGVPWALEEIQKMKGYYDEDGFYVLEEDGAFFDPWGYKFDPNGYDEFGGYYDDDGFYVPGEGYEEEYYKNYEDHEDDLIAQFEYGDQDDDEEEEKMGLEQKKKELKRKLKNELNEEEIQEKEHHIISAIMWLKE